MNLPPNFWRKISDTFCDWRNATQCIRVARRLALHPGKARLLHVPVSIGADDRLRELAAYGPNPGKAEPLPGTAKRRFQEMAAKHKVWIVNSSLIELFDGKKYKTLS